MSNTTTTTTTTKVTNNNNEENDEFKDISANSTMEEIESLCMNCQSQHGITRLMLTKIPFFKEIMIFAFECPECGFKSNEVRHGGKIELQGVHIELHVQSKVDLNRQIVKMDTASISIPILDFEIPAQTQKGCLNTIEGLLSGSITDLTQAIGNLKLRGDTEDSEKLEKFVERLEDLKEFNSGPFTLALHDPSGCSYVENPKAPNADPNMTITHFTRTVEDNEKLGLSDTRVIKQVSIPDNGLEDREVLILPNECAYCGTMGQCKMVVTDIPYFKSVVLMAFTCDECGYKNNEIKAGGAISEKGKILTLRVETIEDLSRDVLKSDTASARIPEIDLEITYGSLGGKFTTVEGLVSVILSELEKNPFFSGDSSDPTTRSKYDYITSKLQGYIDLKEPFTLIIDDPISNSYIQNLYAPDPDPNLEVVEYERTFEQNDELGLIAMKTENYDNQDDKEEEEEEEEKEQDNNKDK